MYDIYNNNYYYIGETQKKVLDTKVYVSSKENKKKKKSYIGIERKLNEKNIFDFC